MVAVDMNPMPSKKFGKSLVHELKFLLNYQKILHTKGIQTFEGRMDQKK